MKVKLELELPELDILFKALKVVDPASIFCGSLKDKIAKEAQTIIDKEQK